MDSSIFSDLKKYNGPIQGVRVHIESDEPKPRGRKKEVDTVVVEIETVKKPKVNMEEIAANVKEPFIVCRDSEGILGDETSLAVKCEFGHMHKYPIKEIRNSGVTKCTTCSSGNKFTTLVRNAAETLLGVPFTIEYVRGEPIKFVNHAIKVWLWCGRTSGNCGREIAEYITVKLYPTTQDKKIKDALRQFLDGWNDLTFNHTETPTQKPTIINLPQVLQPMVPLKSEKLVESQPKSRNAILVGNPTDVKEQSFKLLPIPEDVALPDIASQVCIEDCTINGLLSDKF